MARIARTVAKDGSDDTVYQEGSKSPNKIVMKGEIEKSPAITLMTFKLAQLLFLAHFIGAMKIKRDIMKPW